MRGLNIRIPSRALTGPTPFYNCITPYLNSLQDLVRQKVGWEIEQYFTPRQFSDLLLSACRLEEWRLVTALGLLNINRLLSWVHEWLKPNTVSLRVDDEDTIRLLLFSFEMSYAMFEGRTRATVKQKGFREARRTFEGIVADQFWGKLGEVAFKRFLESKFKVPVELDWAISPQIQKFAKDIVNAKKNVSIKTPRGLADIWAESDLQRDFGVCVKVATPVLHPVIQFFIEVCGFSSLLEFARKKLSPSEPPFEEYIQALQQRIKDYKCGEFRTTITGVICGYFKTSEHEPVPVGIELDYLGKVKEERYLVKLSQLKYNEDDWRNFIQEVGLT